MAGLRNSAAPIAVGLLLGLNLLVAGRQRAMERARSSQFPIAPASGVGEDGARVRWDQSAGEHLESYLPLIPDRTTNRLVTIVGMSQMYTINDSSPGDRIIAERLDDELNGRARVFGLAAPNLAHEEATFILATLLSSPRTRPHVFVFAACFDKLRNVDLRPAFAALLQRPDIREQWSAIIQRYGATYPRATAKMAATLTATDRANGNQETAEALLRAKLASFVPLIAARKNLNAEMQSALFRLRNAVLNIKPTSKRPVMRERYETNLEFIALMQEVARAHDIRFVTYVVPLNPQAENPYITREYDEFKGWLEQFAASRQVPFANLESIVPSEHWGVFMGGPDFKHFRAEGHRLTAAALLARFGPELRGE